MLDRVLGDETGVVGSAARDHEDLVDVAKVLTVDALLVQHNLPTDQVAPQRVGNGARLLLDLLQHEVVEATLFGGREVPADVKMRAIDGLPIERRNRVTIGPDLDDLVLAELDRFPGELDEGGYVAAEEHLALADTEHQG